ncbi:MAG: SOS response-associated peptidase family protein [Betaproteobacteria bacterium]
MAHQPNGGVVGGLAHASAQKGVVLEWCKHGDIVVERLLNEIDGGQYPANKVSVQLVQVLVDNFYEPSYESGKAVRWKIELASGQPFGIACLWDRWTDPASGELVVSFSMLTVNADEHPVMRQFHKPKDEKRTPVIIAPELHDKWLGADIKQASELMTWSHN